MNASFARLGAHSVALRVFGATGGLLAMLVAVLLATRPDTMMAAMHAAASLIFLP